MLYSWTRRCFFRRPWWKMRPSQEVRHLEDKPTGSTSLQPAVRRKAVVELAQSLLLQAEVVLFSRPFRTPSTASRRASSSSSSLSRLSYSKSLILVPISWLATGPREVSSSPSMTRFVRSSSSACNSLPTLEALALPPLAAAFWRFAEFSGACHQQWVCSGFTDTVHWLPSRFTPRHLSVN